MAASVMLIHMLSSDIQACTLHALVARRHQGGTMKQPGSTWKLRCMSKPCLAVWDIQELTRDRRYLAGEDVSVAHLYKFMSELPDDTKELPPRQPGSAKNIGRRSKLLAVLDIC